MMMFIINVLIAPMWPIHFMRFAKICDLKVKERFVD